MSRLKPGQSLGGHPFATTGTTPVEQAYLCHICVDRQATRCVRTSAARLRRVDGCASQFGQVPNRGSIMRSGWGCGVRPTPGSLMPSGGPVPGATMSCFHLCEGGFNDLSGSSADGSVRRPAPRGPPCDSPALQRAVELRQPLVQRRNQRILSR